MVAIDLTPLSVADAPPVTKRPELHLDSQTLDELFAPELWSALAPGLDGADADAAPFEVAAGDGEKLRAALAADGFVAVERPPPWCVDVSRLARAAASLAAHGFPPGFLLAYEASWRLQAQLATVISTATGGNVATGDAIAFRVEPGASGFGPHRDRQPDDAATTFREDDAPRSNVAWVALSRATPANGCMYVVPRRGDNAYAAGGDGAVADPVAAALGADEASGAKACYQRVRALPLDAGGFLLLSHRVVHWGAAAAPDHREPPRVALSFGFADPALEPCLFVDAAMARRPPLDARVALAAAQQVVYARNDSKRRKHDLALFHRVFKARQHYFTEAFRRKVSDRYQWLTFLRKAGASAGG